MSMERSPAYPPHEPLPGRWRQTRAERLTEARRLGVGLSTWQLFWLSVVIRLTVTVALLPNLSASRAGKDAWVGFLTALPFALALAWVATYPGTRQPDRGLVGLARIAFGRWPGTVLAVLYLGAYLLATSVVLRDYAEAITAAILPTTPLVVVVSVTTLLAATIASHDTGTVGRMAVIIGPVLVLSVLLIAVLIMPETELERLRPWLGTGWRGLVSGTLAAVAWHSQFLFYHPYVPALLDVKQAQYAVMGAVAAASLLGAFIAILVVSVLTAAVAVQASFPLFEVARLVSVGEFIQRIDAVAVGAWGLGLIMSAATFFHGAALSIKELAGMRDHRPLIRPMAVILVVVAMQVGRDTLEIRELTDVRTLVPLLAAGVWLPSVIWALLMRWRSPGKHPAAPR